MSSELTQLTDTARQVVSGLGLRADEQEGWSLVSELGWWMVSVPEESSGLGMGLAGACALHGELGRGLSTIPFLPQMLAIDAVCGSSFAQRQEWLDALMAGERRVTTSLAETSLSLGRGEAGGKHLTGIAAAVPSADAASHVLIETADADCLALVALGQPGVTITARPTWDQTRRLFDIAFDGVALDPAAVLAEERSAGPLSQRLAILRNFALAADAVGGAEALLELTVEYLQTRQQFGRPLALFQALKHRCADLKAQTEGARALLQDSLLAAVDAAGEVQLSTAIDMKAQAAKLLACSAFALVAEESLQLHGGIGMTSEHDCHLFLKRALLNEHLGGRQDNYETGLADLYLGGLS